MTEEIKDSVEDTFLPACKSLSSTGESRSWRDQASSSVITESEESNETERHHWAKKTEYVLAAVGYCVGLGNLWRFPYVCMRNGGGAFLIPFILSLCVCALPVYFLESAIGQFHGKSCLHVWNISPIFKGLGLSMNVLTLVFTWYYSIILAWALIYLYHSFSSILPWTQCGQAWNTPHCFVGVKYTTNDSCVSNNTLDSFNASQVNSSSFMDPLGNSSSFVDPLGNGSIADLIGGEDPGIGDVIGCGNSSTNVAKVSAAEEFWLLSMSRPLCPTCF